VTRIGVEPRPVRLRIAGAQGGSRALRALQRRMVECRACPRLVAWREEAGRVKVKRFQQCTYWARPVPGFGDPAARLVIVGLAPAAHGGNRTGRMFTGDRSGDFLFAALHRAAFANQPTSVDREDGLALRDAFIVAPCRCAPPGNWPTPDELRRCSSWLDAELLLLRNTRVLLALGSVGWDAALAHFGRRGIDLPRPRPRFAHGAVARIDGAPALVGSYHVSQQNTNTGKLTADMMDAVLGRARELMQ
jgi:uracil-DNA glycosylase